MQSQLDWESWIKLREEPLVHNLYTEGQPYLEYHKAVRDWALPYNSKTTYHAYERSLISTAAAPTWMVESQIGLGFVDFSPAF